MRLTTWNVNGIRNPFSYPPWNAARSFAAMFDILEADIVVMQELKIQRKDLRDDMVLIDGWDCYFSLPKHKKGYSGVGIYTRNAACAPVRAEEGLLGVLSSSNGVPYCELPEDQSIGGYPNALQVANLGVEPAVLDAEGRCMILEFPAFVLFGVYSPANSNGLRDDFRHGFVCALDCRIRNLLRAGKRVVLVGDLNVSRDELDGASAADDCRKAGITHEEYVSTPNRRIFNQLLLGGEVIGERDEGRERGVLWDTTRAFHAERTGMYTHWEQKINARPGNYGSRIDFVLVAESMKPWVADANIQEGLLGSDHCPVFADFHDQVEADGGQVSLHDIMSPAGVFENGGRRQEWRLLDAPQFSAKRMPEFDKRRTIKSMFAAPKPKPAQGSALEQKEASATLTGDPASSSHAAGESKGALSPTPSALQETPSLPQPPPVKRQPSTQGKSKPAKRQKVDGASSTAKGQQSLKGFFSKQPLQPKEDNALGPAAQSNGESTPASQQSPTKAVLSSAQPSTAASPPHTQEGPPPATPQTVASARTVSPSPSPNSVSTTVAANENTQRSWSRLFTKPRAPLCESHDEPCKTMQTKKKGSNQGRSFWMCARPLGPSGQKEKGTEWRCPTFIWASDWGGGGPKGEGDKGSPGRKASVKSL